MVRRLVFIPGLMVLLVATTVGCGPSGPREYEITGVVTFDGDPLPEGDVTFVPENKDLARQGDKIKDGKYKAKVKEGKQTVEIRATRPVPGKLGPMGEPKIEDFIPAKYNDKSELSIEVGEGKTDHPFDLKSK